METKKLNLPYGIADFASLRQEGYYYVDRSQYIKTLEDLPEKYLVFLRPRRFGKSLFLSLLDYYYGSIYVDLVLFQRSPYLSVKYQFLFELKYCKKDSHQSLINELIKEGREQLQKYRQAREIADKIANKDCPLKPYLLIFSGRECVYYELFEARQTPPKIDPFRLPSLSTTP